jgi:hypothetical protein
VSSNPVAASGPSVRVEEADGRIYIYLSGPGSGRLAVDLLRSFPGHHELYYSHTRARWRLWARDRERLERWLERWCGAAHVEWAGRMGEDQGTVLS